MLPITANHTVREVLTAHPETTAVFAKYGLVGCGGPQGPLEPIGFFARVHAVDAEALLAELNQVVATAEAHSSPPATADPAALPADIYRPFVKTAIVVALTAGCTLGALALAAMALAGAVGNTWPAVVQAHGHAQIFGWVGLFIMGVAYHVLPRLKATDLHARPLAAASFWLLTAGLTVRTFAQPLATAAPFAGLVVLSAALEVAAAAIFAHVIWRTLRANPAVAEFWDRYVLASAVWFVVTALATLALAALMAREGRDIIPPAFDAAYLHMALWGFPGVMILGISLRTIPLFMGLRRANQNAFLPVFWLLNGGIAVHGLLPLLASLVGLQVPAWLVAAGASAEFIAAAAFVYHLNLFRPRALDTADEPGVARDYEKFIHAAYAWLLAAATLGAGYAIAEAVTGEAVPHALVGAYRHALTVGFISMIIVGMAARIVPVFHGQPLFSPRLLGVSFILLNAGNLTRVLSQPLADFVGGPFFTTMGVSGFVEVAALALFGLNLWRTMDADAEPTASYEEDGPITARTVVAEAIRRVPAGVEILAAYGFTQLRNPIARRTLARAVTLEQAANMRGIDVQELVDALNAARAHQAQQSTYAA